MPGIIQLSDVYKKQGIQEAKKFLEGQVQITEKLDSHRFSFQVNEDKSISFYKKNDNNALSITDRIISDMYERAINHVQNIPQRVIKNIPTNFRFGFSYLPTKKPLRIKYDFIPENFLVLTDITKRNTKGRVKKVYENSEFLGRWADILEVSKPPILFSGILTEENQNMLSEIYQGNPKALAFFTEHIESVFGKTYSNNQIIEGIVIKGKGKLCQISDPTYQIFEQEQRPKISRDFYDLLVIQIQEFSKAWEFPKNISEIIKDEIYVEIVSEMFNDFVYFNQPDKNIDASYLRPNIVGQHGKTGRKFINNSVTCRLINESNVYEEIFKIFLTTFKRKRKAFGLLTEGIISDLNIITDKILNLCEDNYVSFNDFKLLRNAPIVEDEEDELNKQIEKGADDEEAEDELDKQIDKGAEDEETKDT